MIMGKEIPLFSIIVPVYNNENDLKKCIKSILSQSYGDFELILVDDGSTDDSPRICDQFADKDKRVRVIHKKKNCGTAAARNEGFCHASGKYIYYVDGDDWISRELLKKASQELSKEDAPDIYVFRYVKVLENNKYKKSPLKMKEGLYEKERLEKEVYPVMICRVGKTIKKGIDSGSLCDKIIRRELFKDHYCKDVSLFRGEDSVCSWECMYYADKIYFSNSYMYFYNRNSISSGKKKYCDDLFENNRAVAKYLRAHLKPEQDFLIEKQINTLEFRGMVGVIRQEIDFHHSIYHGAKLLKEKSKGIKNICSDKGLPLYVHPYILLLNLRCFGILLMCAIFRYCFDGVLDLFGKLAWKVLNRKKRSKAKRG